MLLADLQTRYVAACDDFRMGRCSEAQFRGQLERLGYTAAMQDREVCGNAPVDFIPVRVSSKISAPM